MLILSGVAVVTLTGENGILERARLAKENTEEKTLEEQRILDGYENEIDKYNRNTITISDEDYQTIMSKINDLGTNDTEWKTLSTGVKYKKKNGYVTVKCNWINSVTIPENCTVDSNILLGTLPEGYRPDSDCIFTISYGDYNKCSGACYVSTDGRMRLVGKDSGTYITGVFVFPI